MLGGQFNGGRMVVTEVVSLMKGEWSCYRGGQSNGGGMVVIEEASICTFKSPHLPHHQNMRGEREDYACKNRESMVMLWRLSL